jgi:GNAT superfamily N-acetyltransferase
MNYFLIAAHDILGDAVPARAEEVDDMMEPAAYSHAEVLRDGRRTEIRALRPGDRAGLLAAVGRVAAPSLYRRFLGAKHGFTEKEVEFFSNVDFINQVALVAVMPEDGRETIVAGARYIVGQPGQAEVAFMVVDDYQGLGIGAALMSHLAAIAHAAGIRELIAEVLSDNAAMLAVFKKSGFPLSTKRESSVVHVTIQLS